MVSMLVFIGECHIYPKVNPPKTYGGIIDGGWDTALLVVFAASIPKISSFKELHSPLTSVWARTTWWTSPARP